MLRPYQIVEGDEKVVSLNKAGISKRHRREVRRTAKPSVLVCEFPMKTLQSCHNLDKLSMAFENRPMQIIA